MDPLTDISVGVIVTAAGKALAVAVAKSGLSVVVNWLSDEGWRRMLAKTAADDVGLATAEEPTRRWLDSEETKRLLVSSEIDSNLLTLRDGLATELANEWEANVRGAG